MRSREEQLAFNSWVEYFRSLGHAYDESFEYARHAMEQEARKSAASGR